MKKLLFRNNVIERVQYILEINKFKECNIETVECIHLIYLKPYNWKENDFYIFEVIFWTTFLKQATKNNKKRKRNHHKISWLNWNVTH